MSHSKSEFMIVINKIKETGPKIFHQFKSDKGK